MKNPFSAFPAAFAFVHLAINKPGIIKTILRVRQKRLTYLGRRALSDLANSVLAVEQAKLTGRIIEAGCALGGSALVICSSKKNSRPFFIYDTFEMIPPPSDLDGNDAHERFEQIQLGKSEGINGETYYGYRSNLLENVKDSFVEFGMPVNKNQVHLIKGLFQETLIIDGPVALAHLDCDWYDSVMTCLTNIEPKLVLNGVLIIDDYFDWSGCKRAVDEYFADKRERYHFEIKSRLIIRRIQ